MPTGIPLYRDGGDALDLLHREFDHSLNRIFGGPSIAAPYAVDVRENADNVYVEAELPGFKKEEVQVSFENGTLTISAERTEHRHENEQSAQWLLNERRYTRFLRSFTLPSTVDEKSVQAKLADGILTITLRKREETKPRRINVG